MTEQVLVFEEAEMQWFPGLKGYSPDLVHVQTFRERVAKKTFFMDREKAEKDPTHKQIIPYTIVQNIHSKRILAYKRTKKGGEGRLHDKWSIGIGGHMNPEDRQYNGQPEYMNAMARELKEEIGVTDGRAALIGTLYDPSNSVGEVHFGVVVAFLVSDDVIESNEDAIDKDLKWVTLKEGLELPNLENWSKLILKELTNDY